MGAGVLLQAWGRGFHLGSWGARSDNSGPDSGTVTARSLNRAVSDRYAAGSSWPPRARPSVVGDRWAFVSGQSLDKRGTWTAVRSRNDR